MKDNLSYKDWFNSPFYHQLYVARNENEAGPFIDKLLHYLQPAPGSFMLELECGQGHNSKKLAAGGFHVTGTDLATDSIAFAKQFDSEHLSFYEHDMRLPFWGNYFDYIFNFFARFGFFRTRREHDNAIRTVAAALKPGGRFVIDYPNCYYAIDHLVSSETKKINNTNYQIQRWHNDTHFISKIEISDNSLPSPLSFTIETFKFSLGDLTDMMSFQGLQVQEVFGDYQLGPYDIRKSPRMIVVAAKINTAPADKEKRLYSDGRKTDALT